MDENKSTRLRFTVRFIGLCDSNIDASLPPDSLPRSDDLSGQGGLKVGNFSEADNFLLRRNSYS